MIPNIPDTKHTIDSSILFNWMYQELKEREIRQKELIKEIKHELERQEQCRIKLEDKHEKLALNFARLTGKLAGLALICGFFPTMLTFLWKLAVKWI